MTLNYKDIEKMGVFVFAIALIKLAWKTIRGAFKLCLNL
jgi:hypothetical protein